MEQNPAPVSHWTDCGLQRQRRAVEHAHRIGLLHHPAVRGGRQHVAPERAAATRILGGGERQRARHTRRGQRTAAIATVAPRRSRPAARPSAARPRRTARTTGTSARRVQQRRRPRERDGPRWSAPATASRPARQNATTARTGTGSERRPPAIPHEPTPRRRSGPAATTPQPRLTCCSSRPSWYIGGTPDSRPRFRPATDARRGARDSPTTSRCSRNRSARGNASAGSVHCDWSGRVSRVRQTAGGQHDEACRP